ncbi:MAG: LicD family protein [Chitinivibrionales bacterium]|nr:LicD family protein [Chitinivibrionales bacterium]
MERSNIYEIPDRRCEGESLLRQVQLVQLRLLEVFAWICRKGSLNYWLDFGTLLGAARHQGFIPWDDDVDVSMVREDFNTFLEIAPRLLPHDIFLQTMQTDPAFDLYSVGLKLRDKYSTMIEEPAANYHQGIFLDVFPYDKTPGNKLLRYLQRRLYRILITGHELKLKKNWLDNRFYRKLLLQRLYRVLDKNRAARMILDLYRLDKNHFYRPMLEWKWYEHYFTHEQLFPLSIIQFEGLPMQCPRDVDSYLRVLFGDYAELPPPEQRKPLHIAHADPFAPCNHAEVLQWHAKTISAEGLGNF